MIYNSVTQFMKYGNFTISSIAEAIKKKKNLKKIEVSVSWLPRVLDIAYQFNPLLNAKTFYRPFFLRFCTVVAFQVTYFYGKENSFLLNSSEHTDCSAATTAGLRLLAGQTTLLHGGKDNGRKAGHNHFLQTNRPSMVILLFKRFPPSFDF